MSHAGATYLVYIFHVVIQFIDDVAQMLYQNYILVSNPLNLLFTPFTRWAMHGSQNTYVWLYLNARWYFTSHPIILHQLLCLIVDILYIPYVNPLFVSSLLTRLQIIKK